MHDRSFGSLRVASIPTLSARLASAVCDFASPRAVTIDPDGKVWLEPVAIAVDDDLVGVYTRGPGVLDLTRWIADDLREARVRLVRNHERLQGKRA